MWLASFVSRLRISTYFIYYNLLRSRHENEKKNFIGLNIVTRYLNNQHQKYHQFQMICGFYFYASSELIFEVREIVMLLSRSSTFLLSSVFTIFSCWLSTIDQQLLKSQAFCSHCFPWIWIYYEVYPKWIVSFYSFENKF